MLDTDAVDELDLAIVDALWLRPRASWARIARWPRVDAAGGGQGPGRIR